MIAATKSAGFALAALVATASCLAHGAQIFRCVDARGAVTYQETACALASDERAWQTPEYPPVNTAERDRLLQREAALDARLLKRAELDTAERIAREERRARELELASQREQASPEPPLYIIPWTLRPPRPHRIFPRTIPNGGRI